MRGRRRRIVRRSRLARVSHTHQTRRCCIEEAGFLPFGKAVYLPNFSISSSNILLEKPLPKQDENRYDAYTPWLQANSAQLVSKSHAVGLVYFAHKDGPAWRALSASTFFILVHNGKRVGVTALHALQFDDLDQSSIKAYITPDNRRTDLFDMFQTGALEKKEWKLVTVRKDLLEARKKYIQHIANSVPTYSPGDALESLPLIVQENLDPTFKLQQATTLDVLFFNIPDDVLTLYDPADDLKLAAAMPDLNKEVGLIAIHCTEDEDEDDTKDEYAATMMTPAKPSECIYPHLSVSLCLLREIGSGLVCLEGSTAEQSSGGPFLDQNGDVIAISLCGFYDDPGEVPKQPLFTVVNADDLFHVDVRLPEHPDAYKQSTSKNRLAGLSVNHTGFKDLLDKL